MDDAWFLELHSKRLSFRIEKEVLDKKNLISGAF
jgi:hypothetical protein